MLQHASEAGACPHPWPGKHGVGHGQNLLSLQLLSTTFCGDQEETPTASNHRFQAAGMTGESMSWTRERLTSEDD